MDFPKLKIIKAKAIEDIGLKTADTLKALPPHATVAVSGGSTYKKIVRIWRDALGGARFRLFPVDERVVPFSGPESNWGMLERDLLDPLDWPLSKRCFVEIMEGDAAHAYQRLLKKVFDEPMPRFDLIFLGVGSDGHTASLFPGSRDLDDDTSWVLQTQSPNPPRKRITLGMGVIRRARQIVIIMTGPEKAPVLGKILAAADPLPIVRVLKSPVQKILFLDPDAAGPLGPNEI